MNTSASHMLFRADATPEIGAGHVVRCLALADAARTRFGYDTIFFVSEQTPKTVPLLLRSKHLVVCLSEEEMATPKQQAQAIEKWLGQENDSVCSWLVVDHYGLEARFERACRSFAPSILVIDDLADRAHDCDVLLDQSLGRTEQDYEGHVPEHVRYLLGTEYALLRPQFRQYRQVSLARRDEGVHLKRILLSFGGTMGADPVESALQAIAQMLPSVDVDVVMGVVAEGGGAAWSDRFPMKIRVFNDVDNMAELMAAADLAIGAAGTTSWERCCLGVPSIVFTVADNQKMNATNLALVGATVDAGRWSDQNCEMLTQLLNEIVQTPNQLLEMSNAARSICDGRGRDRVLMGLSNGVRSVSGELSFRLIEPSDLETLYAWQCHPGTRTYCRNPEIPSLDEHRAWFSKRLYSPFEQTFIVQLDGGAVGMLSLDRWAEADEHNKAGPWEVSIVVAPEQRGQGVASKALSMLIKIVPGLDLVAEVASENTSSMKLFAQHGFGTTSQSNIYIRKASS